MATASAPAAQFVAHPKRANFVRYVIVHITSLCVMFPAHSCISSTRFAYILCKLASPNPCVCTSQPRNAPWLQLNGGMCTTIDYSCLIDLKKNTHRTISPICLLLRIITYKFSTYGAHRPETGVVFGVTRRKMLKFHRHKLW